MNLCVLASGSSGNALAVWDGECGFLLDCGVSYKQLVRRMRQSDIDPYWFQSVVLTHGHGDHLEGLRLWCTNHPSPVYGTRMLFQSIADPHKGEQCNTKGCWRCKLAEFMDLHDRMGKMVEFRVPFTVPGGFRLTPLPSVHDFPDTVAYRIDHGDKSVLVAVETGRITTDMAEHLPDADALFIEANFDVNLLSTCEDRPESVLFRTVRTHLSNDVVANVMHRLSPRTKYVTLLHLSSENNRPEIARTMAAEALEAAGREDVCLFVATQDEPGEVLSL